MKITLLVLLSLFIGWSPLYAQKLTRTLTEGTKIHSNIQIDSQHQYELRMEKDQFVLIILEQKGMDVKIVTYDPNGKQIEEFDSPNGSFGSEFIVIDAHQSGVYLLKVIPLGEKKKEKEGSYTIQLIALNNSITSHLDESFKLIGDANYLPGFFISIIDDEKIRYTNGQGFANIKEQIPYTVTTIQQIESISKTFLGLSLMLLVQEGKLDLDENITTYLPFNVTNPYFPNTPITLRHLATHTASINDREQEEKFSWIENKEVFLQNKDKYIHKERRNYYEGILDNKEMSMEDFLNSFFTAKGKNYSKKNFLKNKPGKQWYYSNIGATLAAYIVQLVSEQPYREFVKQRIIIPLKLAHTTWGYPSEMYSVNTLKYGGGKNEYPRIMGPTYPDGAIYSSTADLSQYLMQWMKGYAGATILLNDTSYQEIMKVQFEETNGQFKGIKNGLFWWLFKENRMGHNGGNMGTNANMFCYPDLGVGYISLENMQYRESDGAMIQSDPIKKILTRYVKYFRNE